MTSPLILAIDQGGQSSRVGVYSAQGELLHCFSASCATTHEMVGDVEYIEQNPVEILKGIQSCLDQVRVALGKDVARISAAGFSGQGSSLLCWNVKTGEALSPVLSWQDIRGKHYLKDISLTHEQAQSRTGLRVSPHYGASKMRWCLENNSQVKHAFDAGALAVGPIVSYILWHLCDEFSVDPGHAQRTLLWNLHTKDWDENLLQLFKIPREILPKCKYHNSNYGSLVLGQFKIPFRTCARDQGASLFACGLPDKHVGYINIGTGAFIQRVSERLTAPEGLLVSPLWIPEQTAAQTDIELASPVCYANQFEPALYAWEATVNGAASAISFIEKETGVAITPNVIQRVLELEPAHACYFLNAVGGLSTPYWRTDLESRFSENLSADEKILAWLESILFQIFVNLKLMQQLGPLQKLYVSGGISRADSICQRLADLSGVPVVRSENTEASLQGIAYMAAGLPSGWNQSVGQEIFQPKSNPRLLNRYSLWQNALNDWLSA